MDVAMTEPTAYLVPSYVTLSYFCDFLRNESEYDENSTNVFATEEPAYEEGSLLDLIMHRNSNGSNNETWQFNKTEVVMRLETTSELGIVPIMAGIGICMNLLLSVMLKNDPQLRRVSYAMLQTLIFCEILFLSSVLVFVAFRRSDFRFDVDVMSYVTASMSLCQFLMHWVFLLMQREVYRSVKGTWYPNKLQTCKLHTCHLILLLVIGLAIHLPYVPYLRIHIHKLHNVFNPCTVPLNDIWDINSTIRRHTTDWYYVLYFFMFYFVSLYALPFFLIGCKDKDIVDLLFLLKNKTKLHPLTIEAAHTAMSVSVLSNIFLVCVSTKAIVLGFRIVHFFCIVFKGSIPMFFIFMNVFGNVANVARPSFNLLVFLTYTTRYRHRFWACVKRRLRASRKCRSTIRRPC